MADKPESAPIVSGEVTVQIAATKDGVAMVFKPPMAATLLDPDQARDWAKRIRRAADAVEQYQRDQRGKVTLL